MSFANVLNQEIPKKILSGALRKNMLASTYLFYGEVGTGKWAQALELAKAINCENDENQGCDLCLSCRKIDKLIHPDVKMIFPVPSVKTQEETERFKREKIKDPYAVVKFEKNVNIPVDQIRQMQKELCLKPFEGKRKVVIITEVENMHPSSANSLLKTLEEPPSDSNLILTTTDINRLLPTVVSRCQQIRFGKIPSPLIEKRLKERYQIPQEKASFYAKISNGSLGKATDFIGGGKENIRQDAAGLLETSMEGNTIKIMEKVDEFQNRWDRNSILEMFEFLISLFRDIYITLETSGLMVSLSNRKEELLNYDIASEVVKLSKKFKRQNKVEDGLKIIDQIRLDCKTKNANLKLALLTLCFKLRDLSKNKPICYDVGSV
ncbi:MAG: DNA polymerase III subunit [candidate division Zixibacteria bacterium]|nr:DNA polymerase III subunit [candidate division Zixibacteria bacterium]